MNPAIDSSVASWHEIVATGDTGRLRPLLAPDGVFRSPVACRACHGAERTELVLATAASVCEDFTYHRRFVEGNDVALEFSARTGDTGLKGIDLIRKNDSGQITEFEVMVRPASGLQAQGQAMARRLGARL